MPVVNVSSPCRNSSNKFILSSIKSNYQHQPSIALRRAINKYPLKIESWKIKYQNFKMRLPCLKAYPANKADNNHTSLNSEFPHWRYKKTNSPTDFKPKYHTRDAWRNRSNNYWLEIADLMLNWHKLTCKTTGNCKKSNTSWTKSNLPFKT